MSEALKKAAKGNRAALTELYEANKQRIKLISASLLGNESAADTATVWVFKNTWGLLLSGKITTDAELKSFLDKKTAEYCRKQILKRNPQALTPPANGNFQINAGAYSRKKNDSLLDYLLFSLPELQRFVFVLHQLAGFDKAEIASAVKLDETAVSAILESEKPNIEEILKVSGKEASAQSLKAYIDKQTALTKLSDSADKQVKDSINDIASPLEQKAKQRTVVVLIVVIAAVIVAAGIIIGIALSRNSGAKTTESNQSDVSSVSNVSGESDTADTNSIEFTTEINPTHYAEIDIKDYGTITVALDGNIAPETVDNFVSLAQSGFYDGLTFHRIMEGFMMQGGDPDGNGMGGSDKKITGEFADNGFNNPLSHVRGAISMARSGGNSSSAYNSASSQFFIVHEDSTFLDRQYAAFGYVTDGMEVVDAVCTDAEPTDNNGTIPAEKQPVINKITITEASA